MRKGFNDFSLRGNAVDPTGQDPDFLPALIQAPTTPTKPTINAASP